MTPRILHNVEEAVVAVEDQHTAHFAAMDHGADVRKCPQHSHRGQHLVIEAVAHSFIPRFQPLIQALDISLGSERPDGVHAREAAMRCLSARMPAVTSSVLRDVLRSCPVKGFFVPMDRTETTDDIKPIEFE